MKDAPSAFSERVAGVAGGHGYKVHDVAEIFWSDFGRIVDRKLATRCFDIYIIAEFVAILLFYAIVPSTIL